MSSSIETEMRLDDLPRVRIPGDEPTLKKLEEKAGIIQASKYDVGKPRFALVPIRAHEAVALVFTYGGEKYAVGNWHAGDSFDWDRLLSAQERHIAAFKMGEDNDPDTGYPHLAHAMCCLYMLLELQLTGHGNDNRSVFQYLPELINA